MAAVYKCTKLGFGPSAGDPGNPLHVRVEYYDPTASPPVPLATEFNTTVANVSDTTLLEGVVDTAVASEHSGDTIDWTL